ncbi:MAG TPA: dihydrofolate reductase [Mycobacterium sp.]|nr:dihydrofolate reductase [Mycobacterium sp.]
MSVGLIWAQSASGVIGRGGAIPWHLPEDLARFKRLTLGHPVVMGRLTWESLPARVRPLPGRRNVVLTRQDGYRADGARVAGSLPDALGDRDVWVIGGEQVLAQALPLAARCEVTEVDVPIVCDDADVMAPVLGEDWIAEDADWQVSSSGLRYRFSTYHRAR